jgi:hypothetical protein
VGHNLAAAKPHQLRRVESHASRAPNFTNHIAKLLREFVSFVFRPFSERNSTDFAQDISLIPKALQKNPRHPRARKSNVAGHQLAFRVAPPPFAMYPIGKQLRYFGRDAPRESIAHGP